MTIELKTSLKPLSEEVKYYSHCDRILPTLVHDALAAHAYKQAIGEAKAKTRVLYPGEHWESNNAPSADWIESRAAELLAQWGMK